MYEQSDKIITSLFAGAGGAFAGAAIFVNSFGIPIENPGSIPFALICGILTLWLTYRIKCINSYNELCHSYPNGVTEWLLDNNLISSVDASIQKIPYSSKKKVLCSHKEIVIKEQYVRDQYNYLERVYSYGIKEFNPRNDKTIKVLAIHKTEEIKKIDSDIIHKRNIANFRIEFAKFQNEYPLGIEEWLHLNQAQTPLNPILLEKFWQERREIKNYEQKKKDEISIAKWRKEQNSFSKKCRDLKDELLSKSGSYLYHIPIVGFSHSNENMIWHIFQYSYCLEEDLDYTHFPQKVKTGHLIKEKKAYLPIEQADSIAAYINKLNKDEKTNVYFCPTMEGWDSSFYNYLSTNVIGCLDDSIDYLDMSDPLSDTLTAEQTDVDKWISSLERRIVIVDLVTDYNRLITICKEVIGMTKDKFPLISFISIFKEFTREEMAELIDKDQKERKEKARRALEVVISQDSLVKSVSSWDTLAGGLHYFFLFYYYPTTCDFEATEEEWANRWIIWDFKNTPGKTSETEHQNTLNKVIPMIKDNLLKSFEGKNLKYLTLVCIPASSQLKTQARYKEFSQRICNELGMINAYPHITVTKEKEEKHLGGSDLDINKLHFDEEFFKGKYVLLFDDIITKGKSMVTFKNKMESLGAIVIGGLALGKTKHERPVTQFDLKIPHIFSDIEKSDDDLPF